MVLQSKVQNMNSFLEEWGISLRQAQAPINAIKLSILGMGLKSRLHKRIYP